MKRREQARRIAMQAMYMLDLCGEDWSPKAVEFVRESTRDPEIYLFARELAEAAWAWRDQADDLIERAAEHWHIDRMAVLDRNILRLATWEIARRDDIPDRVSLDQAIELAKTFGAAESGGFVNGVLDHVLRIVRQNREAEEADAGEATDAPSDAVEPPPSTQPPTGEE